MGSIISARGTLSTTYLPTHDVICSTALSKLGSGYPIESAPRGAALFVVGIADGVVAERKQRQRQMDAVFLHAQCARFGPWPWVGNFLFVRAGMPLCARAWGEGGGGGGG